MNRLWEVPCWVAKYASISVVFSLHWNSPIMWTKRRARKKIPHYVEIKFENVTTDVKIHAKRVPKEEAKGKNERAESMKIKPTINKRSGSKLEFYFHEMKWNEILFPCANDSDVPLPRIFIYLFDEVLFSQKRVHLLFFAHAPLSSSKWKCDDVVATHIYILISCCVCVMCACERKKKYKLLLL